MPGRIKGIHVPGGPGVRIDKAVYSGYMIPPYYDSMIAKLIVRARTRDLALKKMRSCLSEFVVEGIPTTVEFHQQIFDHPDFIAGNYDNNFLQNKFVGGDVKKKDESRAAKQSMTLKRPGEDSVAKVAEDEVESSTSSSSQ